MAALAFADVASDAIKMRRDLMKLDGERGKLLFGMMQGTTPFDAAKATEAAAGINIAGHTFATEFDKYFPAGSETGDTKASPDIWKNKADFIALAAAMETDAKATADAAAQGLEAFKAPMGKLGGDCKNCHEKYKLR